MTAITDAAARAERFAALHLSGCFLLPNAWDAGSARLLASLGPVALATTSAGAAWTLGLADSAMTRADAIANAAAILADTTLPVSADLGALAPVLERAGRPLVRAAATLLPALALHPAPAADRRPARVGRIQAAHPRIGPSQPRPRA
jgi:hypothetical protein